MTNRFRSIIPAIILILLFETSVQALPDGYIDLSLTPAYQPKAELNLDKTFIALSAKAAAHNREISALMRSLEAIHLHSYNREANNIDEIRRHYKERLDVDGWKVLTKIEEEMGTIQVHTLLGYDTVYGIFVVVDTETATVFVNIVGRVAPDGVRKLLANLGRIGVAVPLLEAFDDEEAEMEDVSTTQYLDRDGEPIHEVRIEGNQYISTRQIQNALEQGPDDLANSVRLMKSLLPIKSTRWKIHKEYGKRVATIQIVENDWGKPDFGMNLGFNRVDGWRFGPSLKWAKQPDIWTPEILQLFGDVTYGFSNAIWNYSVGVKTGESILERLNLSATVQIRRLTAVRDRTILPSDGEQFTATFFYGGDSREYYLRDGSELTVRWKPEISPHTVTLRLFDEDHRSLSKSTDWSFGSIFQKGEAKPDNRPITHGHLRSSVLTYDFNKTRKHRNFPVGHHHAIETEHSDSFVGSDFDFTRVRGDFRIYRRISQNILAGRIAVGISTHPLPIQRQFIIGGAGTLRGYDLHEFVGDQMALFNLEYYHKLVFGDTMFLMAFADAGHAWNKLGDFDSQDMKHNLGVGLTIRSAGSFFVVTAAQSLEWEESPRFRFKRKPRFGLRWARMF